MALHSARGKLIGVIGDEDTCVGFLLGGVGELNKELCHWYINADISQAKFSQNMLIHPLQK